MDIVTPTFRFLRSKAGDTQQTSTLGCGHGRGKAQVNLVESSNIPIMATKDGTLKDSGATIGASLDGLIQVLVLYLASQPCYGVGSKWANMGRKEGLHPQAFSF